MIDLGDSKVRVAETKHGADGLVLVDPAPASALAASSSNRAAPSLAARWVFFASRMDAGVRASVTAILAAVLLGSSALFGALVFVA